MTRLKVIATRLRRAREISRKYHALACEFDHISPQSLIVCFSAKNPHTEKVNRASIVVLKLFRELRGEA